MSITMSARETTCSKCHATQAVVSTSRDGVPYCVVCWQVYASKLTEVIPTIAVSLNGYNGPCLHSSIDSAMEDMETMDDFYDVISSFVPYVRHAITARFATACRPLIIQPIDRTRLTITFGRITRGELAIMPEFDGY